MKYFSTFSGIGGFELGIQQAYERCTSAESANSESEQAESKIQFGGERSSVETEHSVLPTDNGRVRPVCVGYSEIDKYATQIFTRHFPKIKNYGDITTINEKELPDFDLFVGGFPCQSFSIAGKRGGFSDTRGTMFFEIARIVREKQPRLLLLENVKGLLSHDKGSTFRTIVSTLDELGYDLQWQVLNSKNHGVPQNRERVFIIGHLRGTPRPEVFPFGETDEEDTKPVINPLKDKTKYGWHFEQNVYDKKGVSRSLKAGGGSGNMPKVLLDKSGEYNEQCSCVDIRRLTPLECERLQGFPDGWTEGVSDTQRYKTLGNAVTVNVIRDIMQKLL
jgi:DNA (cytosine-5)-methyltransferase 1